MTSHNPATPRVGLACVPWERLDLETGAGPRRVLQVTSHRSEFSGPSLSWLFLVCQSPSDDIFVAAALRAPRYRDGVWTSSEPNRIGVRCINAYRKWLELDPVRGATTIVSADAAFLLDAYANVTANDAPVVMASRSDLAALSPEAITAALRRKVRRSSADTTDEDNLRRLLELWQKPLHPSVLNFEAKFGGLRVPDVEVPDDPSWFDEPYECWFLGTYSLLAEDSAGLASSDKYPDLVPIGMGPDEGIAYLDESGRVFVEDTLEGQLAPDELSGTAFVESVLTTVRQ